MKLMHSQASAKPQDRHCFQFRIQARVQVQSRIWQWGAIALSFGLANFSSLPVAASGLGGAWSGWLPTSVLTATDCATKARQTLTRQRFLRVASNGLVTYGDLNSGSNVSVFMICSALGDQLLVLVSSREISMPEMESIRARVANDFISQ